MLILCLSIIAALMLTDPVEAKSEKEYVTQPEQSSTLLLDLRGQWKFRIGDDLAWANPELSTRDWRSIFVPGSWEDEGYPGYDGYGWYRKEFVAGIEMKGQTLSLHLGRIDDVSEVFFNGVKLGRAGSFPPDYESAFHRFQSYHLPEELLRFGKHNVIAVRVYDQTLAGGMLEGRHGIYSEGPQRLDHDLRGLWHLTTGDNLRYKEAGFIPEGWREVYVPQHWDHFGLEEYDGFGWYRRNFTLSDEFPQGRIALLMGKVDDYDQVFINGVEVGRTGDLDRAEIGALNDKWLEFRVYVFNSDLLNRVGENVIAVRVFDTMEDGGIYEGPVGLIGLDAFLQHYESVDDPITNSKPPSTPTFWQIVNDLFRWLIND